MDVTGTGQLGLFYCLKCNEALLFLLPFIGLVWLLLAQSEYSPTSAYGFHQCSHI